MHPLERAALWAVAAVLVVGGLLWATGEISGRLFGGVWPNTRFAEMGLVLARFHAHAGDPALAWPAPERALIPGPIPFYSTLAVLLVPIAVGTFLVIRHRARTHGHAEPVRAGQDADLRTLRVRASQPRRLTLGRIDGHLIAAEPRESVIVIGPTQSGKTTGFAIPAILEWQGPVLATSIKSDLLNDTYAARSTIPDADFLIYDPTHSTGYATAGWTPLAGCETWQELSGSRPGSSMPPAPRAPGSRTRFWYGAARSSSRLFFSPRPHRRHHGGRRQVAGHQDEREVKWGLDARQRNRCQERIRRHPEARGTNPLERLRDRRDGARGLRRPRRPRVCGDVRHQCRRPAGRRSPHGLHLRAGARAAPPQAALSALIQEIVAGAYERANRSGKPLDPPLLLVLDECANIAPLRDLPTLASTGAGQGIQLVSVFQDMAQINAVYGRDHAPTIVSNHRAKVVLSGIGDPRTLDYVAALLGDEEVRQVASTRGAEGRRSTTSPSPTGRSRPRTSCVR